MKLSITLPSLFPTALAQAVRNIYAATREVEYEIVIVSPFEVAGPRIRWVREERPAGNCRAHAMAFENSTGDVVVAGSDDAMLAAGWDRALLDHLLRREAAVPDQRLLVGLNQTNGMLGTVFGIYYPFFP